MQTENLKHSTILFNILNFKCTKYDFAKQLNVKLQLKTNCKIHAINVRLYLCLYLRD